MPWETLGKKTARYSNFCVARLKIRVASLPLSASKLRPWIIVPSLYCMCIPHQQPIFNVCFLNIIGVRKLTHDHDNDTISWWYNMVLAWSVLLTSYMVYSCTCVLLCILRQFAGGSWHYTWIPWNLSFRYILFHEKRLQTMLWHHNARVNSHQR